MIKSLQKKKSERKIGFKPPKKSEDIIPIKQISEDGICLVGKNTFTKIFSFSDINYSISDDNSKEDIQISYGTVLNSLDPYALWKLTVLNCRRTDKEVENEILLPQHNDRLQKYRDEINDMLKEKINDSSPYEVHRYLSCSIVKNSLEEARSYFNRIEMELATVFNDFKSEISALNENDVLELYHNFFRPKEKDKWLYDGADRRKNGDSFKSYIAPYSFKPAFDHFEFGDQFGRGMLLTEYPNSLTDTFIKSLLNLKINICFTIDINPITKNEAIKLVGDKELAVEAEIYKFQQRQNNNNNFSAAIPFERAQQREDVASMYNDVFNDDQHLFFCSATLVHTADTLEELNSDTETIQTAVREKNLNFDTAKIATRQIKCLNTALPYGLSLMECDYRPLTTQSLAAFVPFIAKEVCHPTGVYCGMNQSSGNMIMIDRRELFNGNCFILAVSGAGKSFASKTQIAHIVLKYGMEKNTDIILIDPDREYSHLVREFGGEIITLSPSTSNHINPFDINSNYGQDDEGVGDPVKEKSSFILSMVEQILGDEGVSATKKSIIDRAVKKVYQPLVDNDYNGEMPTLKDFVQCIREMSEPEAQELAVQLELYSDGSLDLFAYPTNVDTNANLLCYDILNLGSQLTNLGLLIILDNILNRISKNRELGKTTYIIIDEIHLLFDHQYSSIFLAKLWKRIRKYYGYATGIIQNVSAIIRNPRAHDMLSNSEFTIMLQQSEEDSKILSELYSISRTEMQYLKRGKQGTGLIRAGLNIVPFDNTYPDDTNIYKLMSTKPGEALEFNRK